MNLFEDLNGIRLNISSTPFKLRVTTIVQMEERSSSSSIIGVPVTLSLLKGVEEMTVSPANASIVYHSDSGLL